MGSTHYGRLRGIPVFCTRRVWRKRLAQRPKTDLGVEAATLLAEERSLRDLETG